MAVGAALGGAFINASASSKASKAQVAAANAQTELEREIYGETTERFQPLYEDNLLGHNALMYELGLGERPTWGGTPLDVREYTETIAPQVGQTWNPQDPGDTGRSAGYQPAQTRNAFAVGDQVFYDRALADDYAQANATGAQEYQGFEAIPWQNYIMEQGQRSIDASAASRGKLNSGATLKALSDYGQTTGNQFYQNYLSVLSGMSGNAQNAAGNMATAGANYATGAGNALGAIGNARAAGAIGVGNAINGGIGNVLGAWNYQNMQSGGNANALSTPWAAKGFWG